MASNIFWNVIEPLLVRLGLYSVADPTYGRWSISHYEPHLPLIDDPNVSHTFCRIFLPDIDTFASARDAYRSSEILRSESAPNRTGLKSNSTPSKRWLCYSTWELNSPPSGGWEEDGRGLGRDLILLHGLSDYGLRYTPHVMHFLRAGFRVILPDLPSYGYSTGINSYLPSVDLLPAALHTILLDLVHRDVSSERKQRKVFLCGASMGGWTCLYYVLQHPPTSSTAKILAQDNPHPIHDSLPNGGDDPEQSPRPSVAGVFVLCPMAEVAKSTRPLMITELVARLLRYFAGSLPLAKGVRGKVSDDPRVEEDFLADPLCYHGWLRVGTGLSLLEGMTELEKRGHDIDVPIRLIHGSKDRVTGPAGTLRLFDRLPNADKEVEIYDGYEHAMLRVGRDEQDDQERQRVLNDWRHWLIQSDMMHPGSVPIS